MSRPKFTGVWMNNKGQEGLFELVCTMCPSEVGTNPANGKVFLRNQNAPGAEVSEIECEGQYYVNDNGIPVVEFKFFDVHALCTIGQIGTLQGTFISSRDHGQYVGERTDGQQGEFEKLFHPFITRMKGGTSCTLNALMHIIKSDILGNQFANVPLKRGDVSEYCWMPRDRRQYSQWRLRNSKDAALQFCSRPIVVGNTPVYYPNGWIRFGFRQPTKPVHSLLYHGTGPDAVLPILTSALRPGPAQEGAPGGMRCVFLTPSIVYASSPRYAAGSSSSGFSDVFRCGSVFVQCVLEVCTFCAPDRRQAETLGVGWAGGGWATRPWGAQEAAGRPYPEDHKVIDPDFGSNYDLEWLFGVTDDADSLAKMQITGLLVRVTDQDPEVAYQSRKESTPVTSH